VISSLLGPRNTLWQAAFGVFINVFPDSTDPIGELKQIQDVIEACQRAKVKKAVQSAVGGLQNFKEQSRQR